MRLRVPCPAKVNTFLAVGPRDPRGYHPLRTIFQAIGLFDILTIDTDAVKTTIDCDWNELPVNNTLTKTLRLVGEVVSLPPLHIRLSKSIPAQSGLGGGSSDAAGLLRGLRRILGDQLKDYEMHSIAAAVGADVPFFLVGGRARAEGYGEILDPLPDEPKQWLVIAQPDVGCSTPEMYARLDEKSYPWRDFPKTAEFYNEFERVAPCECLELIERLRGLGAQNAALSGSGSAVCGLFPHEAAAQEASGKIAVARVFTAPTLTREESLRIRQS